MSADYPSRTGVGDSDGIPCRFAGVDVAHSCETAVVRGRRDADGILRIDRVGMPLPVVDELRVFYENHPLAGHPYIADPAVVGQRDRYDGQLGVVTHAGPNPRQDGAPVDDGFPPNGCTRCGQMERGHPGGDYAYQAPSDALRLTRMKARREARLDPPASPELSPEIFATFAVDTARVAEVMRGLGETIARGLAPVFAQMRNVAFTLSTAAGDPELERAKNWLAQGNTCAHVCGPDPGHVCDARATTTIRHALPSGGTRTLPLCGPCRAAETVDTVRDNPGTSNRETADRTGRA